jgi:large subunit ribosomal protein L10
MTREEKTQIIEELAEKFANTGFFYITDGGGMTVAKVNSFRRLCFDRGIEYKVFKNSLIKKALERQTADYSAFDPVLKGFSGVLFGHNNGKEIAKLLKDFHGKDKNPMPAFKGASIDTSVFVGDGQLEVLLTLKTKQEMIGEIVGLLQSPAKNVISGLQGGGHKIAGILKTLSERQ